MTPTGAPKVWKKQVAGTEGRQPGEMGKHVPILALGFSGASGETLGSGGRGNELP